MSGTTGRGAQVVFTNTSAQRASRGGYGRTMQENMARKASLEADGTASDGSTVDGSTLSGLHAEDVIYGRYYGDDQWMNGPLTMLADPVNPMHVATKQYVDARVGGGPFLPLTGGTVTGPLLYTATGGTVSRSAQDRAGGFLTVEDFGAKGDGITDDSAAFNAFASYVRSSTAYQPQRTLMLSANKTYLILNPINFNSFGYYRVTINGNGSTIIAAVGGTKAAISAMASCIAFKDLRVHAQGPVLYGIQIGIVDATFTGDLACLMDSVTIIGTFVNACLYNRGAEDSAFRDCHFENTTTTGTSYAAIMDGCVHWAIDQTTITDSLFNGSNQNISFNAQTTLNGILISRADAGAGAAVWMGGGCNRHNYIASYAQVTAANPIVVYYAPNATMALTGLTWDVHGEVAPTCQFFITGPYATPVIGELVFYDHYNQVVVNGSVFKLDATITSCTLRNLDYRAPLNQNSNVTLFDQPAKYTVTGKAEVPTAAAFNSPASFNGLLLSGAPQVVSGMFGNTTVNGTLTATGVASFNSGAAIVGTGTGPASSVYLLSAAANQRTIGIFTGNAGAGGQRWMFGGNSSAEGGGNAGSDFFIQAFSDAGASLGLPLQIARSTQQTLISSLRITGTVGFNNTAPVAKPTVSGAKGSNAALASLLTALAAYGLVTDSTTA